MKANKESYYWTYSLGNENDSQRKLICLVTMLFPSLFEMFNKVFKVSLYTVYIKIGWQHL